MKKALFFAGLAAATLSFVGCNKEADYAGNGTPIEIVLNTVDTRTVNEGLETKWKANDALSVFYASAGTTEWSANTKFTVTDTEAGLAKGEVSLTAESNDWYLFYPYKSQIPNPKTTLEDNTRDGYVYVGSGANSSQKQTGLNSMAHLAGGDLPMVGIQKGVAASEQPNVTMKHLTTVARVNVTNATAAPITITAVSFTAPENVVGTYFIDFSGDEPDFTESGDSYVSKTARLEVKDAEPLAAGATASFYIAMKPFTAPVGSTLKVQVYAGAEVSESELALTNAVSFQANHIKKLNVEYAPEAVEGKTLAEALALADNTDVTLVPLTVGAVSTKGYVVTDGTDGLYVYVNSTPSVKVGDVVKVTGKMASYYGVRQVASPSQTVVTEGDGTFEADWTDITANFESYTNSSSAPVKYEATVVKSGTHTNFKVEGAETFVGTLTNAPSAMFEGINEGDKVRVYGYFSTINTTNNLVGVYAYKLEVISAGVSFKAELPGADESLSLTVPATTTSKTINVTGNVAWTAAASEGATVDPASGEGAGTVTVSFPANTDPAPKDYTVVVSTDNAAIIAAGGDEYVFTITQEAASGELTATIDFSEQEYANGEEVVTATADGVTFTFDKGTNSTAPKYYNTGTAVRMYGSNTLTVAAAGKTITSIVFTFGSGDGTNSITASVPTYEEPAWTGEAGSVTFTIGGTTGQRRIKAITVKYLDSGSPAASLVSIAVSGQKTEFNVGDEFTHDTAKVTATYSDDTTKDVTASATFSAPDMATAGTKEVTVSYTEGVTKTTSYNITVSAPTTLTVSQSVALADDATGIVGDAIVAAISTKGFIATDGTQNVYVYLNKQPEVALGDKVGFSFKKTTFFGLPELTTIANLTVASHGNTIPRTELKDITATIDTYNSSETDYLTVTGTLEKSGSYYNVTVSGATKYASPMYLYGIDPSALVDQQVVMTGYFNTINSSKGAVQFIATEIKAADANVKYCVVDPEVLNVNATATSATLTIQANAAWTVTSDNSAFTVSPASGSTDKTVTITFAANETQTAKVANITVACPDASVNKTIVLTQAAAVPQGDGYTIVFGNNSNSTASIAETTKASTVISSGTEYVTDKPFTVNTGKAYYGDTKDCIRIGKTGEASKLTIALSSEGQVAATSIVVNCRRAVGNKNVNAMLTVNGVGPLAPAANDAAAASDVVFTLSSSENLESIVLEGTAAIYIYSITVNK